MFSIVYRYKWIIAFFAILMLFGLITKPTINHSDPGGTGLSKADNNLAKMSFNDHVLPSGTELKLRQRQSSYINKTSSIKVQDTNAVTNPSLLNNQQNRGFTDPNIFSTDERLRESAVHRIQLEEADMLEQLIFNDDSPIVRNSAMERLLQLEPEYEQTNQIMRSPGEAGHFLPAILKGLSNETDPIAIQSGLEYIGHFGEDNKEAKIVVDSLLSRTDIDPPTVDFIAELLVENFGQNPDEVKQRILNRENMN